MPELPEVETIARKLRAALTGKRIAAVKLSGHKLRREITPGFRLSLRGRTVVGIHRRGKYIVAELEPRSFWLVHLGMSGRLWYGPRSGPPPEHTHARVLFSDSTELQYRDHRRFGLLAFYETERLSDIPELQLLGREPLDRRLTGDWLHAELVRSRQEVKAFLLDQRRIAGLGNIYVCEALFAAGVRPSARCNTLTADQAIRLCRGIRSVILSGIRNRGTTFSDFVDSDGEQGDNQRFLRVFQREGEICRRCRSTILRIRQGNRSSFYCPQCQT